jgi:hypothetical protein
MAAEKNALPLPQIRQDYGLRLPNDRFCQVQPNFAYVAKRNPGIMIFGERGGDHDHDFEEPEPFAHTTAGDGEEDYEEVEEQEAHHYKAPAGNYSENNGGSAGQMPALAFSTETVSKLLGKRSASEALGPDDEENYD